MADIAITTLYVRDSDFHYLSIVRPRGDVVKGIRLKNSQRAALLAASAVATASRSLRTDATREARSERT